MNPRIEHLKKKKLIGLNVKMSLTDNRTGQLWRQFSPRVKEVQNRVADDKISLQIYPPSYFEQFKPTTEFEKWATVEVTDFQEIPNGMKTLIVNGGLYAVFDYKGPSSDMSIFQYIFSKWLPSSNYAIDDRPHFEVLGSQYKNDDLESEEEIWIPIRQK
ncbi:GyrI-like domain-containing protein [Muricauda sp. JGD-17]|uniref:GyrI-like domain-containing protein n=1 Tax=Flagellimonas ochracea TaxID=2696472 RepID=A0A964TBC7_9FLAO|nr:GyrI-like domain-containing protein [Allomuricauda ochracea]NAY91727.1 GyrI-like domain-containing protein [Allomuricauda ochracea]